MLGNHVRICSSCSDSFFYNWRIVIIVIVLLYQNNLPSLTCPNLSSFYAKSRAGKLVGGMMTRRHVNFLTRLFTQPTHVPFHSLSAKRLADLSLPGAVWLLSFVLFSICLETVSFQWLECFIEDAKNDSTQLICLVECNWKYNEVLEWPVRDQYHWPIRPVRAIDQVLH